MPIQPTGLIEVARFRRKALANERALVIAAMGVPYWLLREEDRYLLCVDAKDADAVRLELQKFEGERTLRPRRRRDYYGAPLKIPVTSLFVFTWVMVGVFAFQQRMSEEWVNKGVASSEAILRGEVWRTVTALTLHADVAHLAANLVIGALFAAFLLPLLGTGVTWAAILSAGALGNWLNAFGHRGESHNSIGASTAVFGALGLLVGCQLMSKFSAGRGVRLWEFIVPVGAGLSLLAFLGVGDQRVDFMAHFLGLTVGAFMGLVAGGLQPGLHLSVRAQRSLGAASLLVIAGAWIIACRN